MFSTNILRRLRPDTVSRSFSSIQSTAARHAAPFAVCCSRVPSGSELTFSNVRRSFLNRYNAVQVLCPSLRCLSTKTNSEDGELVYTGVLGKTVRRVKMFSYSTSGASLILMPQILFKTGLGVNSFYLQAAFIGVIGFFTFLTPVLLHLATKGYVTRLYHNRDSDTYTAITYSIFLTEKRTVFHQTQVKIPDISRMFTTFYAGSMGLQVNPDLFPAPQDYNHLMGYDKPFTFDEDISRSEKS